MVLIFFSRCHVFYPLFHLSGLPFSFFVNNLTFSLLSTFFIPSLRFLSLIAISHHFLAFHCLSLPFLFFSPMSILHFPLFSRFFAFSQLIFIFFCFFRLFHRFMLRFWDGLRAEIEKTVRPVRLVIYPYVNDHLKESEALTSGANCHAAIICNASYADLQFLEDTQLPIPVVLYNRVCNGYCSVNVDDLKMGALAARAFADQGCKTAAVLTSIKECVMPFSSK